MDEQRRRWSLGELVFAALFVVASAVSWWLAMRLWEEGGKLPLFLAGLAVAAASYAVLVGIDGTHRSSRRLSIALATASFLPLSLRSAPLLTVGAAILSGLVLEVGTIRIGQERMALRRPSATALGRRAFSFYFASVSILLTAAISAASFRAETLSQLLPEGFVRKVIVAADPILRPITGIPLSGTVDETIRAATGITDAREIARIRSNFSKRLGLTLTGEEDIAAILAETTHRSYAQFEESFGSAFRVGFLLAAFLLFRFLSIPLSWAATIVLYVFIAFAKRVGLAADIEEPIVRTILRWE